MSKSKPRLLRIYTDTSVIGGCFDAEFAEESLRLIVTPQVVNHEIQDPG